MHKKSPKKLIRISKLHFVVYFRANEAASSAGWLASLCVTTISLTGFVIAISFLLSADWCSLKTGENVLTDRRGMQHAAYVSRTRDGSIWLRFSADAKYSQDWNKVNETVAQVDTTFIDAETIKILDSYDYFDAWCVLTDLVISVKANASYHPSFISAYDPRERAVKTMVFRHGNNTRYICITFYYASRSGFSFSFYETFNKHTSKRLLSLRLSLISNSSYRL
ncbi:hypothetical protein HELRODRAFT_170833 [Helobdella robusta]|uniref:Uncharacterized protein n=1 Tax=Helobdella robusta TaxID=6412 RepID=T1F3H6_HELRO|nr:hypothetical protein HELRODRAFT_170833 [Helobdella robusta]ESO06811.1 hypothetical protein HELRODRAFT_170833 [Helobdella robusta]